MMLAADALAVLAGLRIDAVEALNTTAHMKKLFPAPDAQTRLLQVVRVRRRIDVDSRFGSPEIRLQS